jgi:hypothetical protein
MSYQVEPLQKDQGKAVGFTKNSNPTAEVLSPTGTGVSFKPASIARDSAVLALGCGPGTEIVRSSPK